MKNKVLAAFLVCASVSVNLYAQGTIIRGNRTMVGTTNYCADAGSTDTYACNISPAPTSYVTGAVYYFLANTANTGAATANFNGLGAISIRKNKDQTLADNDIKAGQLVALLYDGTNMQMFSQLGNVSAGGSGGITAGSGQFWHYFSFTRTFFLPGNSQPNRVQAWRFVAPYSANLTHANVSFSAASGTGCSGGTCGLIIGLYSPDGNTLLGTARATSGGTPDINAIGTISIPFLSSVAITGGQDYIWVLSTDSSSLGIYAFDINASMLPVANANHVVFGTCPNLSTGNGNAIAFAATCGVLTASGSVAPPIWAFVH